LPDYPSIEPADDAISFDRSVPGFPVPDSPRRPSRFSPDWSPPMNIAGARAPIPSVDRVPAQRRRVTEQDIERAAGTGLSGHSDQEFVPIHLGPLENEATVITLRIVIGSDEALAEDSTRPLHSQHAPVRPAARP